MRNRFILMVFFILTLFFIQSCSNPDNQLLNAIKDNDVEAADKAIKNGADVNICDDDSKPAIILALELKRKKIATKMLNENVKLNVRTKDGT